MQFLVLATCFLTSYAWLEEGSSGLEGFDLRPTEGDENMMELADDSVQGFFDHRGMISPIY